MLIDSNAPKNMWSEAALAAVYLLNRCPTRSLDNLKTPAEMWLEIPPKLDKIRVFGCKAYVWIPHQCHKKLDVRSKKTIMVGYAPNGYRLWDIQNSKVIIARDAKFEESCFPYSFIQKELKNEVRRE